MNKLVGMQRIMADARDINVSNKRYSIELVSSIMKFMETQKPEPKKYSVDLEIKVEIDLVTVEGSERFEFEIVPDDFADFTLGYLGISTPLAQTILNHNEGETIPYPVEGGIEARIIAVAPSQKSPPKEIAERRQATIRRAIEQSDHTNAVMFASSFSGKWGDYDPGSITDETNKEEK